MEIQHLRSLGLISDWWQYDELPTQVLDDARLISRAMNHVNEVKQNGR